MPGPGDNRKRRKVHRGLAGISAASLGAGHCSVGKHVRPKTNRWETRLFTSCVPPRTNCSLLEGDLGRHLQGILQLCMSQAPMPPDFRTPRTPSPQVQKMLQEGSLRRPITFKPLTLKGFACTNRRIECALGIPEACLDLASWAGEPSSR